MPWEVLGLLGGFVGTHLWVGGTEGVEYVIYPEFIFCICHSKLILPLSHQRKWNFRSDLIGSYYSLVQRSPGSASAVLYRNIILLCLYNFFEIFIAVFFKY